MKISLKNLGKREKFLAIGVGCVLLFFIVEHFVLTPFFVKMENLTIQINANEDKLKRARYVSSQKEYITEAYNKIKPYVETDKSGETGLPSIMKKIEEMAKASGVNLEKMKPEATEAKDTEQYKVKKLTLSTTGSVDNIVKFLYKIENCAYPLRVVKMDFKVKDRNKNLMIANFDLFFVYFGN